MRERKYLFTVFVPLILTTGPLFAGSSSGPGISSSQNEPLQISAQPVQVQECGIITTVAGAGESGFSGDGGLATEAMTGQIRGVAVDSQGNLYIADGSNYRIRKVDPQGIITTIAGTGGVGSSGDGGPATSATLQLPGKVAVDSQGNIYTTERYRIRKIDTQGIITTVAGPGETGTGESGFSGDGGPATLAAIGECDGLTVDAQGNLYIANRQNRRVRKIDTQGIITTVAGPGTGDVGDGGPATSATMSPLGLSVDSQGNLYIVDGLYTTVRKVDALGTITTIAGNLSHPTGVAVDPAGNVYVAESSLGRVQKIDTQGIITTVAGTGGVGFSGDGGPATLATLSIPWGLSIDSKNLYIADGGNHRVRKVGLCEPEEGQVSNPGFFEKESGFVDPSLPPQGRTVSPASQGRAKAGVPPIKRKAAPAERAAAKPSLLQRIRSFFRFR